MIKTYALHGYYQVLSDMQEMDFNNDTVQQVVRLMYEYDEVDSMGKMSKGSCQEVPTFEFEVIEKMMIDFYKKHRE